MVNISASGIAPAFSTASEKKFLSQLLETQFDNNTPNRQVEQTRIGILSMNLGPQRGEPGAIEKLIASKWHMIALQEAVEFLQHEYLTNHFYISHFAWLRCLVQQEHLQPRKTCQLSLHA